MVWLLGEELTQGLEKPQKFTNPFDYQPHPLVEVAREELCRYISSVSDWQSELSRGKMFGVLVVENAQGQLGFLAAFSGYLAKKTQHEHFVPPILDLQEEGGFFAVEEANISQINREIAALDSSGQIEAITSQLESITEQESREISILKQEYATARAERHAQRQKGSDIEQLNAQSQRQKGILRRRELEFRTLREPLEARLKELRELKAAMSKERAQRSAALQRLTFSRVQPLNAKGDRRDLIKIFEEHNATTPPAGSGECAGPKLMHYAYANGLTPIAMGEFWWGESTRGEVRHHLHYYAACRGKCHPILSYMLQGLDVEPPRERTSEEVLKDRLSVIYEDDYLVAFNKPSGLASVRGLSHTISVQSIAEERYPHVDPNNLIVHRLDMDTSGVLIVAKSAEVQHNLQAQFAAHTTRKRYIAILEGVLGRQGGAVELPLALDPLDRPRQRVDYKHGKAAYTRYKVISVESGRTRVALYPQTGRTHQLRVHCAHSAGLNTPIVGDRLYGTPDERLMLHAEQITLLHPFTLRKFTLSAPAEFTPDFCKEVK